MKQVSPKMDDLDGEHCTMSPEKFEGKEYNSADEDFYSLGCLLFYLKTGMYPSSKSIDDKGDRKTSLNDVLIR